MNFGLSDRFCYDLIVNTHETEKFVRISESSNYPVFELTGAVLTVFLKEKS